MNLKFNGVAQVDPKNLRIGDWVLVGQVAHRITRFANNANRVSAHYFTTLRNGGLKDNQITWWGAISGKALRVLPEKTLVPFYVADDNEIMLALMATQGDWTTLTGEHDMILAHVERFSHQRMVEYALDPSAIYPCRARATQKALEIWKLGYK